MIELSREFASREVKAAVARERGAVRENVMIGEDESPAAETAARKRCRAGNNQRALGKVLDGGIQSSLNINGNAVADFLMPRRGTSGADFSSDGRRADSCRIR
jgi:hypothetical protein